MTDYRVKNHPILEINKNIDFISFTFNGKKIYAKRGEMIFGEKDPSVTVLTQKSAFTVSGFNFIASFIYRNAFLVSPR